METEFDLRGEEGRKEGSSSRNFANYNFSLNFNAPSFLPSSALFAFAPLTAAALPKQAAAVGSRAQGASLELERRSD
jgi:hypothetical protein